MSTEDRLYCAAREGDVVSLYTLIHEDPHVFEHIDSIPFDETPLHIAASMGHLRFAAEIMRLKPSFVLKPNQEGLCPIHLAMQHGQKSMALRFVKFNKDIVKVKGRDDLTPLHLASQNGYVDLLSEFLSACPDSIEDVTVRSETALHVAVKNHQHDALKHLTQWLKKNVRRGATELEKKILNWKDEEGNTILHISALNNDPKALRLPLKALMSLKLEAKNLEEKTALDIAGSAEIDNLLKNAAKWKIFDNTKVIKFIRGLWHVSDEDRNAYLVVATLIATATYQAALSPRGGLYQANPGTDNTLSHLKTINSSLNWKPDTGIGGNSVMANPDFIMFSSTNMFSFLLSTFYGLSLPPKKSFWWFRMLFLTISLQLSYIFSMMVISPTRVTTEFLVAIFVIWMFAGYLFLAIHFILIFL